jgi:hypothetical protein
MVAKVQTELDSVVEEMTKEALLRPLDVTKPLLSTGPTKVEQIDVDGFFVKLMFSYDVFPDKAFWHLSISTNGNMVPNSVLTKIKKAFFKDADVIEMPSILFGGKVKQYLSRAKT